MAGNSEKTAGKRGRPFEKGKSGNPSGRPKRTAEEQDALACIRSLAPAAAETIRQLMLDKEGSPSSRIKCAEIVLERTYGKPDVSVNLSTGDFSALDEAFAAMDGDAE